MTDNSPATPPTAHQPDARLLRQVALGTPAGFLAFGFGSGLSPRAPGTAGSLAALPFGILLQALPLAWAALLVVLAYLVGIRLCEQASRQLGVHDHGGIVWDEMVGLWLVLLLVPADWRGWLAAFLLFRAFDIIKPWPIRWLDRHLHGGQGIMLDDLVAAAMAGACCLVLFRWLI